MSRTVEHHLRRRADDIVQPAGAGLRNFDPATGRFVSAPVPKVAVVVVLTRQQLRSQARLGAKKKVQP